MYSKLSLLLLQYPLILFLDHFFIKAKFSHFLKINLLHLISFAIFSFLFSNYIEMIPSKPILLLMGISYLMNSLFLKRYELIDLLFNYTCFWCSILIYWGGHSLDQLLFLFVLFPLFQKGSISKQYLSILTWMLLILLNSVIKKMTIVDGLILKNYLIEIFIILYLSYFLRLIKKDSLISYFVLVFSIHKVLISIGYIPLYFTYLCFVIQFILLITYIKNEDLNSFLLALVINMSLLLPTFDLGSIQMLFLFILGIVWFLFYHLNEEYPLIKQYEFQIKLILAVFYISNITNYLEGDFYLLLSTSFFLLFCFKGILVSYRARWCK